MGVKTINLRRISFIVGNLENGGAEKQFLYLVRALLNHGVKAQVLLLNRPSYPIETLANLGIDVLLLQSGSVFHRLYQIHRYVQRFQPDFIQATHFYCSFYSGIIGRMLKIPSIGAIRGDFFHDLEGIGYWGSLITKFPDVFIANSHNARKNAADSGLDPNRIFVLPNVIDLHEFDRRALEAAPDKSHPQSQQRVITVARLIKLKRLDVFIRSIHLVQEKIPNLSGWIVGTGPEEAVLRQVASETAQGDEILFLGNRNDVPSLLKQSNLFILTSEQEGFPNVILEAMAASLPIITTPAGETKEIIDNGTNGFIIPFNDAKAIASKIIELTTNPSLSRQVGSAARQLVMDKFSYETLEKTIISFYEDISSQVRSQPTKQMRRIQGKL